MGWVQPRDPDPTAGRQEPGNGVQQRGLAGPVRTDYRHPVTGLDREVDTGHDLDAAPLDPDVVTLDGGRDAHSRPL